VDFPGAALEAIQHAYALTVHSGQGSEYKHVIAVATPGSASFINRTMLFTGLSRARDFLEVFGQDEVLRKIAATPMPGRNTGLVRRVLLELGDDEGAQAEEDADRVVEPTGRMRYRAMRGG
jgi:exodeoxyribonuclease V alpha subunit